MISKNIKPPGRASLAMLCFIWASLWSHASVAESSERSAIIEAARKYLLHGLVEHKPALVPLAENCWRVEQAVVFYDLHVTGIEQPVLIAERFKVVDGLIEEIEALIYQPSPASGGEP